jgi:DNA replication protein DnaC
MTSNTLRRPPTGSRWWVAKDPEAVAVLERTVATLDAAPKPHACEVCKGARVVLSREKRVGTSTRLEGMPPAIRDVEPCPACSRPEAADLLAAAGIPPLYDGCTFATFPRDDLKASAVQAVEQWVEQGPVESLMLRGANGRGKTGLACAAVRALCERGVAAKFVALRTLLQQVKDSGFDERVLSSMRAAPVLVLDDLGQARATPWVQEQVVGLLEDRRVTSRPTVITCDVDAVQLERDYGDSAGRLLSRLREFKVITVEGADLRGRR